MSLPFCGLLSLRVLLNSLGKVLGKRTDLINRLLGVTLEEEMKKPLLWLSLLPGESDRNSRWVSPGWQQWKISPRLWSPRALYRANWTNQSWVMLLCTGITKWLMEFQQWPIFVPISKCFFYPQKGNQGELLVKQYPFSTLPGEIHK